MATEAALKNQVMQVQIILCFVFRIYDGILCLDLFCKKALLHIIYNNSQAFPFLTSALSKNTLEIVLFRLFLFAKCFFHVVAERRLESVQKNCRTSM